MIMTAQITQEIFEAFLKCPTKSRLYSNGAHGIESEFGKWQRRTQETYNSAASEHLRSSLQANEWCIGAPPAEQFNQHRYRLIFDYVAGDAEIQARLHGLELDRSQARVGRDSYIPIRFVAKEKLAPSDRLMLAFDALALSRVMGRVPGVGKIIHGCGYSTVKVPLTKLVGRVRSILGEMASERATSAVSSVVLNRHCPECEFQARCRQIARDKDDLSLLATLSNKERKKYQNKGIFTVTQLSYAFRPRKRSALSVAKHYPALKALAIRENKIHILGTPTLNRSETPVYFDVEGDADRGFYYLIGMRAETAGSTAQYSFWADDTVAEENIWADFLRKLKEIENPRLIHYGSYETQFFKRMRSRYPNTGNPALLDALACSALNLLSIIYAHVYFPTYSNGLKETGNYLGCRWSEARPSGLSALVWRSKWEFSREGQRPGCCRRCNGSLIYRWGRYSQTVYDLKFSRAGIKRWVVRYSFSRYICWKCKATFHLYTRKPKYGAGLCAYLLYQIIEVQIPQNAVAKSVHQLFGLPLSRGLINHVKSIEASRYQTAYSGILDRISAGNLVHADETKVGIGGKDAYVWVFTNLEDVAFVYSETREASTLQDVLSGFRGVLVSDFYAAYDSIECAQQKCLIHLMRDVNDDLCKQPFNEEMRAIAERFARVVRPMIETVDRFGLRAHYLRKHKRAVNQFYNALSTQDFQTEVAVGYKKRFEKNRSKLFTFLDHDGVPWNNNNAEHAIKALVRLRNRIGGQSSAKGMRDYLVLLSISQTCKYKGVSFLDFLLSGQMDIDAFTGRSAGST
ncbi:MAG: hypothetical protein DMG96_14935 [Acidobacteria bacterium]|nr:MAG: hypothetical protein DMG96_14935 [Acidobacteriota bacterium]